MALSPKQKRFIEEYLVDLNGTKAATRAGYSQRTANEQASRLLANVSIRDAIAAVMKARSERTEIKQDRVLEEIAVLSFSDIRNYVLTDMGNVQLAEGAPKSAMRAVSSIKRKVRHLPDNQKEYEVEVKFWDKPGSLKMAGQHLGMFTEKHEHTGPDGGPMEFIEVRLKNAPEQSAEADRKDNP